MGQGWLTKQQFDQRVERRDTANAAVVSAEKQRDAAQSAVVAAQAEVERVSSIITDLTLLSPRDGRVQYRIHRSGEVVNAGTRIVQILDLNDVYMTIYLPAAQAGKLTIGDEARLLVDPYPDSVIPAHVSFVATEAQFTPKKAFDENRTDVTVKLGDSEEWTILNEDSQYHDFHIHQTGILVTEVNGVPTQFDGLRDTFSVPPMRDGKPGAAKMIIPFTNPEIVGRFVFHCHVVKHQDKGMMQTIEVRP